MMVSFRTFLKFPVQHMLYDQIPEFSIVVSMSLKCDEAIHNK